MTRNKYSLYEAIVGQTIDSIEVDEEDIESPGQTKGFAEKKALPNKTGMRKGKEKMVGSGLDGIEVDEEDIESSGQTKGYANKQSSKGFKNKTGMKSVNKMVGKPLKGLKS